MSYHSRSNELIKRSNHNVRVYQFRFLVVEKLDTNEFVVLSILQNNSNNNVDVDTQNFFANFNQSLFHSNNFISTIFFSNQHESKFFAIDQ